VKKFVRQKSVDSSFNGLKLNLRTNAAQVAHIFEPGFYQLRIDGARLVMGNADNVSVALDLIELAGNALVDSRPLWIDGPNANVGRLAAENQNLLARLLQLAGQNIDGDINVAEAITKLVGLVFEGRLALETDNRTGRTYNSLVNVVIDCIQ
jgi:hypothetical protein